MENIITVSGRFDSRINSILNLIGMLDNKIKELGDLDEVEKVIIDLENLEYIDSNVSVILFAYVKYLCNNFAFNMELVAPSNEKVTEVLFKNNFCSLWNDEGIKDYNGTYLKITECSNINDCVQLNINNLLPKLKQINMIDDDAFELIGAILEINQNAFQHGKCDILYVCAQFFPNQHELKLTLFNFGKTFKQNLISYLKNRKENTKLNYRAIKWATENGNTTDSNSAGTGLTRFIDVLKKYNSNLIIISDNEILLNNEKDDFSANLININLKGCLINVIFHLNELNCIK